MKVVYTILYFRSGETAGRINYMEEDLEDWWLYVRKEERSVWLIPGTF